MRGINVGGKNIIPMAALAELVSGLGASDVTTFIQSGNVVFRSSAATLATMPSRVSAAIERRFGFAVPVVVRSAGELARIVAENPFRSIDSAQLHVAFLAATPRSDVALDPARSPPDRFALRGADLYLHLPNGVGKTRYTSAYLDSKLGTTATIRNWNTVNKLLELCSRPG
jgi:uncharacterized protein (DUF1697 family)